MIAPASQFNTVVSEIGGHASHFFDGQVGPLASKQSDGSSHESLRGDKREKARNK
jgi:hypothetical protein